MKMAMTSASTIPANKPTRKVVHMEIWFSPADGWLHRLLRRIYENEGGGEKVRQLQPPLLNLKNEITSSCSIYCINFTLVYFEGKPCSCPQKAETVGCLTLQKLGVSLHPNCEGETIIEMTVFFCSKFLHLPILFWS